MQTVLQLSSYREPARDYGMEPKPPDMAFRLARHRRRIAAEQAALAKRTVREWIHAPVQDLPLDPRIAGNLNAAGITYVHELLNVPRLDLLTMPQIGEAKLEAILRALELVGFPVKRRAAA